VCVWDGGVCVGSASSGRPAFSVDAGGRVIGGSRGCEVVGEDGWATGGWAGIGGDFAGDGDVDGQVLGDATGGRVCAADTRGEGVGGRFGAAGGGSVSFDACGHAVWPAGVPGHAASNCGGRKGGAFVAGGSRGVGGGG